MQADNNDDAKHRSSQESDPADPGSTSQPSSKLREKLQKLAEWRVDPASIEFQEHAPEFRGGHATVSQAFLVSTSASKGSVDDSADTSSDTKSGGGITSRKAVAVKRLNIENGKEKERVLGLALREGGFLTELNHENVIKLEGFVEDLSSDRVWLVFPWATNGNLKDFVALANWEIPERIWLINDVARGVEYLHSRDPPIYHGDLKSANVLVNLEHRAVITDLGSARRLAKKDPPLQPEKKDNGAQLALVLETEFCEATNTMTLTGNQFTLRWAAPELLKDDEPGLWSDIWALGWIFYEVMTNSIPFQNVQKDSAVFIRVIQGNLPSVADHASMVLVRALYSLMITCWSIDPSKRPTAEDCRKSVNWMPQVIPDRQQGTNTPVSRTCSPALLLEMAYMHRSQNNYINATKLLTEALSICTDTANNPAKADALFSLAEVNRGQDNRNEAIAFYMEAAQIYTDIGSKQGRAYALKGLADVYRLQKKYSEAATFYSEVVQICNENGDENKKADALLGLADVHRLQTEYSEAVPLSSEAAQIYADIGNRSGRADALWLLAEVHRLQKQYSHAAQLFSETSQISLDIGNRDRRAGALRGLANVHRDQDQHEDAIRLYEQAAGIFEEVGNTRDAAVASNRAAAARRKLEPAEGE